MAKNSKLAWNSSTLRDPRVIMRVVIGVLLAANLAVAVVAFKPFGGSVEDLRRQAQTLRSQIGRGQARLVETKRMVEKVQAARTVGDQFMTKYLTDRKVSTSTLQDELNHLATEAGIKAGQQSFTPESIEGSDNVIMYSISAAFEGSYANLTKLMNLLDRSPRFLIVENMVAAAPQGQTGQAAGQAERPLNVVLRIDTFVRDETATAGGAL